VSGAVRHRRSRSSFTQPPLGSVCLRQPRSLAPSSAAARPAPGSLRLARARTAPRGEPFTAYFVKLNSALCADPSLRLTTSSRHVPDQLLSVFHT
jgi:hypothetical protein